MLVSAIALAVVTFNVVVIYYAIDIASGDWLGPVNPNFIQRFMLRRTDRQLLLIIVGNSAVCSVAGVITLIFYFYGA